MGLLERYENGESAEVWDALRAGGSSVEEARAVATATMQRAAQNVDTIVARLEAAGYRFAYSRRRRNHPTEEDLAAVIDLPALMRGPLPIALEVCLATVGEVWLCGTHISWDPPAYAFESATKYPTLTDSLVLPPARWVRDELAQLDSDDLLDSDSPFPLAFAPDELHKANISGGTHDILLPDTAVDPVLHGVAGRPGVTLVEYLRVSLRWGGFPGFEFSGEKLPALIEEVRADLIPF